MGQLRDLAISGSKSQGLCHLSGMGEKVGFKVGVETEPFSTDETLVWFQFKVNQVDVPL